MLGGTARAAVRPNRWQRREDDQPEPTALEKELAIVRKRGSALSAGRTGTGGTAVGRGVCGGDSVEAEVRVTMAIGQLINDGDSDPA